MRARLLWWSGAAMGLVALGLGTAHFLSAPGEELHIEALESTDLEAVITAAESLAASGSERAVAPLWRVRGRLLESMAADERHDQKLFGSLDFDTMVQRISDRRQSPQAQLRWHALAAVDRALTALDPGHAAAARAAENVDGAAGLPLPAVDAPPEEAEDESARR